MRSKTLFHGNDRYIVDSIYVGINGWEDAVDSMSEQEKMLQAINTAIEMELDGKQCYLAASKGGTNEAGRKLLLSLAEEEDNR